MQLATLRKNNGLTQEALARSIGIKRTTLKNYELESRRPPIPVLRRLADFYGVSVDELIGHTPRRASEITADNSPDIA